MRETFAPLNSDVRVDQLKATGLLGILSFVQRVVPRGRGAVPRKLGKMLTTPASRFMTTRHGAKLILSPGSFDVYATMRGTGNAWDYHDFEILRAGLPEDGVLYEIGANVGYYALEQAFIDRSSKVFAFEPQTDLAEAIAGSARINGLDNLTIFNTLVGDHSGMATLYLAPGSIHASGVADSGRPVRGTVEMQMMAIDDMIAAGAIPPPDMVKMDVEGSEALVFQGAAKTLRDAKPNIFLEYMTEFDIEDRIRHEIERLLADVPEYRLFGSPRKTGHETRPALFPVTERGQWPAVDGLYLRNVQRAVRTPEILGSFG